MDNTFFQRPIEVARIDTENTGEEQVQEAFFRRDTSVVRIDPETLVPVASPTLGEQILENAKGPKRVAGDAGSVEQHSLKDQIEAERFLQSKKATQTTGFPVRLFKISPDGTT